MHSNKVLEGGRETVYLTFLKNQASFKKLELTLLTILPVHSLGNFGGMYLGPGCLSSLNEFLNPGGPTFLLFFVRSADGCICANFSVFPPKNLGPTVSSFFNGSTERLCK